MIIGQILVENVPSKNKSVENCPLPGGSVDIEIHPVLDKKTPLKKNPPIALSILALATLPANCWSSAARLGFMAPASPVLVTSLVSMIKKKNLRNFWYGSCSYSPY